MAKVVPWCLLSESNFISFHLIICLLQDPHISHLKLVQPPVSLADRIFYCYTSETLKVVSVNKSHLQKDDREKKGCLRECVCGIKSKCDLATPILQKSKGFPLKIKLSSNKRVFIWTWDVAAAILPALCILLQELSSQWDGISNLHQYGSRQKGNKTPADLGKWPMARTSSSREGEKGSFSFDCFYSIQGTSKWWEP